MENKKISFGFSKVTKKNEIISKASKPEKKVELIECLEGQSIKIKDKVEVIDEPLVIPISNKKSNLIDKVREAVESRLKNETETKLNIKEEKLDERPDSELTIDELAARQLIREAQTLNSSHVAAPKIHTLPLVKSEDKFVAEGEVEPTLDDYENVPISEYGFAMLRGMGWKEGMTIGKKQTNTAPPPSVPELRPKGLGLGANKMVSANKPGEQVDKDGKKLVLVKGAYGKIIAGTHKGHYCQVQGFDDDNCRIIVKTAMTNNVLSLNEFLIVPVTKEEYALGSKVLNNAKYEEYKERSERKLSEYRHRSRSRSDSESSAERKRDKRRDASSSSRRKHSKKSSKHKKGKKSKHRSRSSSDSGSDRRTNRR